MNLIFADNHCHISKEYFESPFNEILRLKHNSKLDYIVTMGVNFDNNLEYIKLKSEFNDKFLKIGLGLHPEEVISLGDYAIKELERIQNQIENNIDDLDYIGEIGIDFTYPKSRNYELIQKEIFSKMIDLAIKYNKPVSIHARESFDEIIEILKSKDKKISGFLHCFTGNYEQAKFFIDNGLKLGIGGIITFKKSEELRNTVLKIISENKDLDINNLIGLETDTPYLSPEPVRSSKNNPENIQHIYDYVKNLLKL